MTMAAVQPKDDIIISPTFEAAFNAIEQQDENVFIHGKAGVGKSSFLRFFRRHSRKKSVVLAPTGVAALNVGGQTIHSFFKFKHRFQGLDDIFEKRDKAIYEKLELLIIDEISMVRADIFDAIELFLRLNGPVPGIPFGGVQICVIGDLLQLPPIISHQESQMFYQRYDSPFFFSSESYKAAAFRCIEFNEVFRQSQEGFIALLDHIRCGHLDEETVQQLHARVLQGPKPENAVTLTTTNAIAERVNTEKLCAIDAPEFTYHAELEGDFLQEKYNFPALKALNLKVGAHVMLVRNDPKKRWVNGSFATVASLTETSVEITIQRARGPKNYVLEREEWESIRYEYDEDTDLITEKTTGSFRQFPLIHAWAITIHKSQGKTLDNAVIDLGRGAFAPGQLYVALSRMRSLSDLWLQQPVNKRDVMCDQRVLAFFTPACS